jgi:trypsin-like peptidase
MTPSQPVLFSDLSQDEQRRVLAGTDQVTRLAYRYALPLMITVSPSDNPIRSGSACVLRLARATYLVTAHHIFARWKDLLISEGGGARVAFQALNSAIQPSSQVAYEDPPRDFVAFELSTRQTADLADVAYSPFGAWPPNPILPGQYIVAAGYPAFAREHTSTGEVGFGCVSSLHRVAAAGEGYAVCQFEREHWISTTPECLPPPTTSLGGLSGGPVLRLDQLSYPVVGLVSQFEQNFELLRLQTFAGLDWLADAA